MAIPDHREILTVLADNDIPLVLIGAQALRVYGSSRESFDLDFAARTVDADPILELLYGFGYRLPVAVSADGNQASWATSAADARAIVEMEKRGALNLYFLDQNAPLDQIDFMFDLPMPFARLKANARLIRETPPLYCASVQDLITLKEWRLASGMGSTADQLDLEFLRGLS